MTVRDDQTAPKQQDAYDEEAMKDSDTVQGDQPGQESSDNLDREHKSGTDQAEETTGEEKENPLQKELEELRKKSDENYQRLLRLQADFDNFRRRSRLEKEDYVKYASMKLIEGLLPVMDNFQRAMSTAKGSQDYESLSKGIDMIYRQLEQTLIDEGLAPMQTVGEPFNPELHQAVLQEESDEHEEGIVLEELQKGYMLKDKVLRPAMVKVSK